MIQGTEHMRIGDLIAQRKPFFVPIYQRTYAWEAEEIDDFVNDLQVIYEAQLSDSSTQIVHFFGGLVSVDRFAPQTTTGRRYEIVDGQQRLATFMITIGHIISALESLATSAQDEGDAYTEREASVYAEQTRREFFQYEEVEDGTLHQRLRLRLSKADHVFFENLISGHSPHGSRESHNRLQDAFDKIQNKLVSPILTDITTSIKDKLKRLLTLRSCVTDNCNVVHIVSDDRDEAYQLFTVLNDRGRTLSDGDKLRSYTLELLEEYPECQDQVERYWDNILSDSQSEIDQFLRSYYPSHVGERAPRRNLFDHFQKFFFHYSVIPVATRSDSVEVEHRVANIKVESEVFSKIADGEWPYDSPTVSVWDRDRLYRLIKVLRHTLCIPLLLSACRLLGEQDFSQLVNLLERFVFRYIIIVRVHPGSLADCYYNHSVAIRADPSGYNVSDLESDLHKLSTSSAQDDFFQINLEEKLNYSQSSQRRIIKHFLTTVEDHYTWFRNGAPGSPQPDKTTSYDINHITIEHIYPQNPAVPEEDLESLKHDIGNLAFWAPNDNRAASNDPFEDKKNRYGESNIRLTRDLADIDCWNEQALMKRKKLLIRMALKIFAV